jgi:hypothetical protein
MGDFQAGGVGPSSKIETHNFAGDNAQPAILTVFVTHIEEKLQTQAYSQKRASRSHGFGQWIDKSLLTQVADSVAKRTDARQHDFISSGDLRRISHNLRGSPHVLERLLHAPQVAHAVINNGYQNNKPYFDSRSKRPEITSDAHRMLSSALH